MDSEQRPEGFLRHRGLILVAAGGAVAEGGILTLLAPGARTVAPQVTALPPVAAYHDLRWLFADGQSWQEFAAVLLAVLLAQAALDAALLRLAWPRASLPPRLSRAFWSCLALTALCWVLLSPAVTLTFGAAVMPFSWPLIGALPIMLGVLVALSHGGTVQAWWRRLPPVRAIGWVLASVAVASAAAGVIAHLDVGGALAVVAVAGLFNARAWYAMATLAAQVPAPVRHVSWPPARVVLAIPLAPVAGLVVLALVVGAARLMFTGTIKLVTHPPVAVSVSSAVSAVSASVASASSGGSHSAGIPGNSKPGAVIVVEGWGSWCCDAADGLRAVLEHTAPGLVVRQFSYRGLDAGGNPLRSGPDDDDLALPELGDKIAAQVEALHQATHGPVSVVAESEGTLGVYAMLARHPGLPVESVVLLSPIIAPGQLSYPGAGQGAGTVPPAALDELNHLVGTMSPYGSSGAEQLLASVSEYGAEYFSGVQRLTTASVAALSAQWLAVVPLADALTLPACGLPTGVLVVPAFHGGLLGDPEVLPMVARFVAGQAPQPGDTDQGRLRAAAEVIADATAAWRMPDVSATCGPSR